MTSKKVAQKHFGKKQILPQKYAFDVMLLLAIFKPKAAFKPKTVRLSCSINEKNCLNIFTYFILARRHTSVAFCINLQEISSFQDNAGLFVVQKIALNEICARVKMKS